MLGENDYKAIPKLLRYWMLNMDIHAFQDFIIIEMLCLYDIMLYRFR